MKKSSYLPIVLLFFLKFLILGVHAHADEPTTQASTDPLSLTLVIFSSLGASLVPLVLGFLSYDVIKKQEVLSKDNYLIPVGFSFGVLLFLFFDYATLSSIFAFNIDQIIFQTVKVMIVILVLYGLALLAQSRLEENETDNKTDKMAKFLFLIWAVGIFIHTFGEGIIMGYNLTLGLREAFDPYSISSYVMHKFAEGIIGASLYAMIDTEKKGLLYKVAILAGISILPGAIFGYLAEILYIGNFLNTLNVLVFTIGFTITAYLIPTIVPTKTDLHKENFFLAVSIGLLYMYLGVILHNL